MKQILHDLEKAMLRSYQDEGIIEFDSKFNSQYF